MNGHNLLSDVAYISAYRYGETETENETRHGHLRWTLEQRGVDVLCDAVGYYDAAFERSYIVVGDKDILLSIAREYGQQTLLHRGVLYDVATGAVLQEYHGVDVYHGEPGGVVGYTRIGCLYIVLRP